MIWGLLILGFSAFIMTEIGATFVRPSRDWMVWSGFIVAQLTLMFIGLAQVVPHLPH